MADQHERLSLQAREPRDNRMIVGEHAVAVQLLKIAETLRRVIEHVGPLRVARELGDLPGRKVREDAAGKRLALLLEPPDLLADVELGIVPRVLERVDTGLELGDRLFKIEEFQVHLAAI
jgi:hypothetical protein